MIDPNAPHAASDAGTKRRAKPWKAWALVVSLGVLAGAAGVGGWSHLQNKERLALAKAQHARRAMDQALA